MGCSSSAQRVRQNSSTKKFILSIPADETFMFLDVEELMIRMMEDLFMLLQDDVESEVMALHAPMDFLGLKRNVMLEKIFALNRTANHLAFVPFFVAWWNLGTASKGFLVHYVFDVIRASSTSEIDYSEATVILRNLLGVEKFEAEHNSLDSELGVAIKRFLDLFGPPSAFPAANDKVKTSDVVPVQHQGGSKKLPAADVLLAFISEELLVRPILLLQRQVRLDSLNERCWAQEIERRQARASDLDWNSKLRELLGMADQLTSTPTIRIKELPKRRLVSSRIHRAGDDSSSDDDPFSEIQEEPATVAENKPLLDHDVADPTTYDSPSSGRRDNINSQQPVVYMSLGAGVGAAGGTAAGGKKVSTNKVVVDNNSAGLSVNTTGLNTPAVTDGNTAVVGGPSPSSQQRVSSLTKNRRLSVEMASSTFGAALIGGEVEGKDIVAHSGRRGRRSSLSEAPPSPHP